MERASRGEVKVPPDAIVEFVDSCKDAVTKQLNTLFNDVKGSLDTAYGSQNLDEFVVETFQNVEFRKKLAKINIKGEPVSALQRFANTVVNLLRQVVGKPTTPLTALESADPLIEYILSPSPESRDAEVLFMNSDPEGARNKLDGIPMWANIYNKGAGTDSRATWVGKVKEFLLDFITNSIKKSPLRLTLL